MSLDKLKFILENNNSEGILFDTVEQAFKHAEDNNETIYLFIWENGKFLEQYKVELRGKLSPELLNVIKKYIKDRFGNKAVFYTNYPSNIKSTTGRFIIKDQNFIKFVDY